MIKNLYIVGNGLDIHHGLRTGYLDFRNWLKINRNLLYQLFCVLYDAENDIWWKDFENHLAEINIEKYINFLNNTSLAETNKRLSRWGINEIINENNLLNPDDVQYIVSKEIPYFTKTIADELRTYLNDINLTPKEGCHLPFCYDVENSYYITFNYTETLEQEYKIEPGRIFHIHGDIDKWQDIVLGHGKSLNDITQSISTCSNLHQETLNTIISAVGGIKKDVSGNIAKLSQKGDFKNIENLIIVGFSFSKIDLPYIDYIMENLNSPLKNLIVSFHTQIDINNIQEYFCDKQNIPEGQRISLIYL